MHQDEPDSEINLSPTVVATLVQHSAPKLGKATSERTATYHHPEFKSAKASKEAGIHMKSQWDKPFVTNHSILKEEMGVTTVCQEYTSTRDDEESRPVGMLNDNVVIA